MKKGKETEDKGEGEKSNGSNNWEHNQFVRRKGVCC